jgi:EAL domain-containing protein (putative c-di-GMP-specific phosphodiesterase class I)
MNLEQAVLDKLRELPPDKQQEILDFAEFLQQKNRPRKPLKSVKGLCADLKVDITEEDIAQARQEMWGNFPREDIL